MRARLAIQVSGVTVELREVVLRDKPPELLQLSAKATVPVLLLPGQNVIDESLDIMMWALSRQDPESWLLQGDSCRQETLILIRQNDEEFKGFLDRYKYADRYPEYTAADYRSQAEPFLIQLEQRLQSKQYLMTDKLSLADVAVFPFIRQFANVDPHWFAQAPYPKLQQWLTSLVQSSLFTRVMEKYAKWNPLDQAVIFGECVNPSHG